MKKEKRSSKDRNRIHYTMSWPYTNTARIPHIELLDEYFVEDAYGVFVSRKHIELNQWRDLDGN